MNQKNSIFDYIIVGQGVAGTLLAYFLLADNQRVMVVDRPMAGATSRIAAGLINPVTGRRMAKSWRFEELFSFAKKTYNKLEEELKISIWSDWRILRALPTVFEVNEWSRRGVWPEHAPYFADEADLGKWKGKIKPSLGWGELKGAAKVDMASLIYFFRKKLTDSQLLREELFDFSKIELTENGVEYGGLKARKIIFCEGAKGAENPFFAYLPFVPTKGELLLIKIKGEAFTKILKNHIFIIPVKDDLYWVGSTSRFEYEGPHPTGAKKEYLKNELERVLEGPFEIVEHHAGIRPTVYDKRPFLGVHPQHSQLAIFSGMGTKGALLAPYFASQMTDFLTGKIELEEEVDIVRFIEKYQP